MLITHFYLWLSIRKTFEHEQSKMNKESTKHSVNSSILQWKFSINIVPKSAESQCAYNWIIRTIFNWNFYCGHTKKGSRRSQMNFGEFSLNFGKFFSYVKRRRLKLAYTWIRVSLYCAYDVLALAHTYTSTNTGAHTLK